MNHESTRVQPTATQRRAAALRELAEAAEAVLRETDLGIRPVKLLRERLRTALKKARGEK